MNEEKIEWFIHIDRSWTLLDDEDDKKFMKGRYTLTNNKSHRGWQSDGGYEDYGLPKELAEWICKVLNDSDEIPPIKMDDYGNWVKTKKRFRKK